MNKTEPCVIDGHSFATVEAAHWYLMQVDGRIHLDRLERYLRQGRKILDGHILGRVEDMGHREKRR